MKIHKLHDTTPSHAMRRIMDITLRKIQNEISVHAEDIRKNSSSIEALSGGRAIMADRLCALAEELRDIAGALRLYNSI